MKNSQIHKELKDKEIRDFLAQQLVTLFDEEIKNNELKPIPHIDDVLEHLIQTTEQEIERLKKRLQIYRAKQAILQIIKKQGWNEFDVSDETEKDSLHMSKMSFIGTDKEYNHLLEIINGN
jgi:G3E family GTPase